MEREDGRRVGQERWREVGRDKGIGKAKVRWER